MYIYKKVIGSVTKMCINWIFILNKIIYFSLVNFCQLLSKFIFVVNVIIGFSDHIRYEVWKYTHICTSLYKPYDTVAKTQNWC